MLQNTSTDVAETDVAQTIQHEHTDKSQYTTNYVKPITQLPKLVSSFNYTLASITHTKLST